MKQRHICLLRRPVILGSVAGATASHEIVPCVAAALRLRNDVIQSQFIAPELHAAILANIPIAEQDILSRHNLKADWNMLVSTQPDDTWQVDARIHLNIG